MIKSSLTLLVRRVASLMLVGSILADQAFAILPAPVAPSTAPAGSDFLGYIKGYIKDGGLLLGLAISVAAFLWLAWHVLSDLNQVRNGRKEWGELGMTAVIGAAVALFVTFLLGQAAGVI